MSKTTMLISSYLDESRIAIIKNSQLVELHIGHIDRERTVGNIYRGRVVQVNTSFQAAFVDYGGQRNGFLSIKDIDTSQLERSKSAPRGKIQNLVTAGQRVMVQVMKEGLTNKGAALSTQVSLPGRYVVLQPNQQDRSGISRKIGDRQQREQLKNILSALSAGEDFGLIIRTVGMGRSVPELKKDLSLLKHEWQAIDNKYQEGKAPALLYQEPGPVMRMLRDYYTDDIEEVWVDNLEVYQEALQFFKENLPRMQKRLKLYVEDQSLFSAYQVETQIDSLSESRVELPSGGSLVLESTEALVSVDVNSGRSNQEGDIEETALRTNQEAAKEVARHLRLRNLGGLIVVDFIDMESEKNRKKVISILEEAVESDKARCRLGEISEFGLLEMSRQRIDTVWSHRLMETCSMCTGSGHVPTIDSQVTSLLRAIRDLSAGSDYGIINGEVPLAIANYLHNERREALRDLEMEFDLQIEIKVNLNQSYDLWRPRSYLSGVLREATPSLEEAAEEIVSTRSTSAKGKTPAASRSRSRNAQSARDDSNESNAATTSEAGASQQDRRSKRQSASKEERDRSEKSADRNGNRKSRGAAENSIAESKITQESVGVVNHTLFQSEHVATNGSEPSSDTHVSAPTTGHAALDVLFANEASGAVLFDSASSASVDASAVVEQPAKKEKKPRQAAAKSTKETPKAAAPRPKSPKAPRPKAAAKPAEARSTKPAAPKAAKPKPAKPAAPKTAKPKSTKPATKSEMASDTAR